MKIKYSFLFKKSSIFYYFPYFRIQNDHINRLKLVLLITKVRFLYLYCKNEVIFIVFCTIVNNSHRENEYLNRIFTFDSDKLSRNVLLDRKCDNCHCLEKGDDQNLDLLLDS